MNKKGNLLIKILLALSVIVVLVNALRAGYAPYVKQFATVGTYQNVVQAEVLLVRNETVINPGIAGVYESYVAEGERVSTYSRLGAIVTGDIDEGKMAELNRINSEIEALTKTISEAGVLNIEDDKVASTLSLSVGNLRHAVAKGDVQDAVLLAYDIGILTQRKSGNMTSMSAMEELERLKSARDAITNSLGGTHQAIYSTTYGQYSYKLDGMEQVLTYDNAVKATTRVVDSYFEMAKKGVNHAGVCKIVNNYKWNILFNLESSEAEGLEVGKSYNVSFVDLGEKQLKGKIVSMTEPDRDGRCAVVMSFDKHIDNFTYARITRVEICKEKYSGIYIPSKALRVNEGVLGVWVQNEISLVFRRVTPVYRTDDFVLVKEGSEEQDGFKNIQLYDNIVIDPDE